MIRLKVVKIGNSREVRIPRTLLEQAGLTTDVEMRVERNMLIIQSAIKYARGGGLSLLQWPPMAMINSLFKDPPANGMRTSGQGSQAF
jgi:hypothetical protein